MSDKAYLAALERVQQLKAQREKLREVMESLLASHDDFMACGRDKSLGWPDLDWSEEFAERARAALAETEEKSNA